MAKESLNQMIKRLKWEAEYSKESADTAYTERMQLVSVLSRLYPSWLEDHPEEDKEWENEWRKIVFIDTPEGQASWHMHDKHIELFSHLEFREGNSWDGHTTEEKYKRLSRLNINQ